jgi:drug/metabolite transporter (DMT)-like permease
VWAAGQVSPGVVATLYATMPLVALFMCGPGNSAEIPKLVIGMCGVTVLVAQGLLISVSQIKGGALLAASVVLQAWSFVYARKRLRKGTLLASSAIQLAVAALLTGILSVATERFAMDLSGQSLALLLVLAIGVSGVTVPLLYWLLSEMRPWRVAALQWVTTLVAVVEAGWFLHARLSMEMWVGAAMIVTTVTWLLLGSRSEAVTLQITNEPIGRSDASLSEVD